MKYAKILAASLCAVSLGTVTAPTVNAANASTTVTEVSNELKGITTVTYKTPIVVWAHPGKNPIHKYLPKGSAWKYFKVATTADGESWYNLGGNQWVPSRYMDYGQDPHIGHYVPQVRKGAVATITNKAGAKLYRRDGSTIDRVLRPGSKWKVFVAMNNGIVSYNLGGDQWVHANDVTIR